MNASCVEQFEIVDESNRIIGIAERRKCHGDPSLIHRTAHVVVFHPDGRRILLQRRSMSKDIQPGRWDTAVGGHLDVGESFKEAALREMKEELGLDGVVLEHLFDSKIRNDIESENVRVFATQSAGPFDFEQKEIDEVKFWSNVELEQEMGMDDGRTSFTPNLIEELKHLFRLFPHLGDS